jgi:dipeptidyl aminopeptidase/acylaminoacyl peptidase
MTKIVREGLKNTKPIRKNLFFILLIISFCVILLLIQKNIKMIENTDNSLIPRDIIFGNPDKIAVRISPDGKNLSYIAPLNGVLNIFLAEDHNLDKAHPITSDTHRGIRSYTWTYDSSSIIYQQDNNGDENFHYYKIDLASGRILDLTPFEGTRASLLHMSRDFPNFAIAAINDRRKDFFDLYLINLKNNKIILFYKNDLYSSFDLDDQFNLRFASIPQDDGGSSLYKFEDSSAIRDLIALYSSEDFEKSQASAQEELLEIIQSNKAELFMRIKPEDLYTTDLAGFSKDYNKIYFINSSGRDKGILVEKDLISGEEKMLYQNDKAELESIMQNPITKELEAVSWNYTQSKWHFFDKKLEKIFAALEKKAEKTGEINIISQSLDNKILLMVITSDTSSPNYYKVDLTKGEDNPEITYLFSAHSKLDKFKLAPMYPIVVKASDGLELVSYLTLPKNLDYQITRKDNIVQEIKAPRAVPLILDVHGGPKARDYWGLNKDHQWLADRGYAVLSVNYRGSTGFGKNFVMKGDGEWAGKMHQDLLDLANWAVKSGITSQDTIAIMGGSYGGYAALVGLTFTPDFFRCAVDIVGPSNLKTLLETIPDYWKPGLIMLNKQITGKVNPSEKDLLDRSPITLVDKISKPLLIGHGAMDPRVKVSESDQIVQVMKEKNIPVIYALYPDEGHGFAKPENNKSFYYLIESFFHQHLGGQLEGFNKDFDNSSIEIISGLDSLSEEAKEALNN